MTHWKKFIVKLLGKRIVVQDSGMEIVGYRFWSTLYIFREEKVRVEHD